MFHKLEYLAFGLMSNAALSLYWAAPRSGIQDELLGVHRWALKKAHDARMRDPLQKAIVACTHDAPLQWSEVQWCPACGAVKPHMAESLGLPVGAWSSPVTKEKEPLPWE